MGRACSTNRREEKFMQNFGKKTGTNENMEDLDVEG
jgi:hypothetical protein